MFGSRFAVVTGIMLCVLVLSVLLMSAVQVLCDTDDFNQLLEFQWNAATGDVHHYNVYLSIDGASYSLVGTTPTAPTVENPYAVPIDAEDGKQYRLRVEAEDAGGQTGPMSEPSDPVWCRLRPGYVNGQTPGDVNGDSKVGSEDWAILCKAWNKQAGDALFDNRADLNYDDSVDSLDLDVIRSNWGNSYNQ
jgi:hypothetical protein